MLFDDKTKGIAQAYLSMLGESHFKVGDKVKCKASGMSGTVTKLDKPETGKYYTVKQDSGKEMKYAPDELSKLNEAMDPVNHKELKGKHSDRKDKDIDNDGDVDSSDEYLHNRRKAISKSVKESEIEIEIKNNGKKKDEDEEEEDDEDEDDMVVDTKPSNGNGKDKKKEKEQMAEAKDTAKLAAAIEAYAKKSGGIDKADMMKVAGMLKKGDMKGAAKYAKTLDTDPRDFLLSKMGMMEDIVVDEAYNSDVKRAFPASGVKTGATAPKGTSYMPKDKKKAMGGPANKMKEAVENKKENLPFDPDKKKKAPIAKAGKYGLEKSTVKHLAKQGMKKSMKENYQWNWEAISEAPEEELDAMIEQMNDDELQSFISELESIEEGNNWYQGSTNSKAPTMKDPLAGKHGRSDDLETLDPRAEADRAFANAHRQNVDVKDYPGKDKPVSNAKPQAPVRAGENRNPEPMKTLSDIRKR